jgi:diguanylate cyclase (GGDEF)-like protein
VIALSRLRRRPLVGLFLLVSLMPLLALSVLAIAISSDAVTRRADQSLTLSASLSSRYVGEHLYGLQDIVTSFAHQPGFVTALAEGNPPRYDHAAIDRTLTQLISVRPGIASAELLTADGTLSDIYPTQAPSSGSSAVAISAWFQTVIRSKAPTVSPVYTSDAYGSPLVTAIAAPVYEVAGDGTTGPLLGVLGVEYSVTNVEEFGRQLAAAQGVLVTVLDQQGTMVAQPATGEGATVQSILAQGRLGTRGLLQTQGQDAKLIAYAPVPRIGWTVAAEITVAGAFAEIDRLRITVLAFAVPLALVLLAGAWLLNKTLGHWERAEAEVRRLAAVDSLTGLYNRRSWDEHLARELARARRERRPLSVVMIDLDHFKQFNDERGHPAGDQLLAETAAGWRAGIRATDVLARYGGEEFVLALPDCSPADAVTLVERLRAMIPMGQSCSAGVACWNGKETGANLVARADQALYQAKTQGRNRVVVADDLAAAA